MIRIWYADPTMLPFRTLSLFESQPYLLAIGNDAWDHIAFASKCVTRFLRSMGVFSEADVKYDSKGAPVVIAEKQISISITDEGGCLIVLVALEQSRKPIWGIGIDLAGIKEFDDFLKLPDEVLQSWFYESELTFVRGLNYPENMKAMAQIFSAKEAAFKSMSGLYRKYRQELSEREGNAGAIQDFEVKMSREDVIQLQAHGRSGILLQKYHGNLAAECQLLNEYVFVDCVCQCKS